MIRSPIGICMQMYVCVWDFCICHSGDFADTQLMLLQVFPVCVLEWKYLIFRYFLATRQSFTPTDADEPLLEKGGSLFIVIQDGSISW